MYGSTMTRYALIALLIVALVALWQFARLERDAAQAGVAAAKAESQQLRSALLEAAELVKRRDAVDAQYTKELHDAQEKIDSLRASVRAGERRLSVAARCMPASPGASGMDDAGARAELDPAAADRIIGITADGDAGLIALAGLQDYVTKVCLRKSED
jgi:prophage endopeptidase